MKTAVVNEFISKLNAFYERGFVGAGCFIETLRMYRNLKNLGFTNFDLGRGYDKDDVGIAFTDSSGITEYQVLVSGEFYTLTSNGETELYIENVTKDEILRELQSKPLWSVLSVSSPDQHLYGLRENSLTGYLRTPRRRKAAESLFSNTIVQSRNQGIYVSTLESFTPTR